MTGTEVDRKVLALIYVVKSSGKVVVNYLNYRVSHQDFNLHIHYEQLMNNETSVCEKRK